MRVDHEHSVFGQAPSRDLNQPIFNLRREGSRLEDIETQLDAGRSLINMLPSRTRRLDIALREFPFVEEDRLSYTHKDLVFPLITNEGTVLKTRCVYSPRSQQYSFSLK